MRAALVARGSRTGIHLPIWIAMTGNPATHATITALTLPPQAVVHSAIVGWPLLLVAGVLAVAEIGMTVHRRQRARASGIDRVDRMDGASFEALLVRLFRGLEYEVLESSHIGDEGVDLVVVKDGERTAVHAAHAGGRAGVTAVHQADANREAHACGTAIAISNRDFTLGARRVARSAHVTIWGRSTLMRHLIATRNGQAIPVIETGLRPACALCGISVSDTVRQYCLEHPERFGGNVYCEAHQTLGPLPTVVAAPAHEAQEA